MAAISGLTLVAVPEKITVSPEVARRIRLSEHLAHQLGLAKSEQDGTSYTVPARHWDLSEDGEKNLVTVERRLRKWFVRQSDGTFLLVLRWGTQTIEMEKGKAGIVAKDLADLVAVLARLQAAAQNGELDAALSAAHKRRQQVVRKK